MSPGFVIGCALGGATVYALASLVSIWLRGELTRNGKTCRFGHSWVNVDASALVGQRTPYWECASCVTQATRTPWRVWLRDGHPCFWGHVWCSNVFGVLWACPRCRAQIHEPRVSVRVLERLRMRRPGIEARGGVILYTGRPGTLHVALWLLRGAPVTVSDGMRLPRGYGAARYDMARMTTVCLPLPLNVAYAAVWWAWWQVLVCPALVRRRAVQERELRVQENELQALIIRARRELEAGHAVERQLDRESAAREITFELPRGENYPHE